MFAYIFAPNEPAGVSSLVGEEMAKSGVAVPLLSHHNNVDEVIKLCRSSDAVIFNGALTQLSWLFDTPEKVARWNLEVRVPRVGMSTEMVFGNPPQHGEFQRRCHQAMRVVTHLVGFNVCPAYEMETSRLSQMGVPFLPLSAVPVAFSKFVNSAPWEGRKKRFCFVGTLHGTQRRAVLKELLAAGLVDHITTPKSDHGNLVDIYNRYAGTINPRGAHDIPIPFVPRLMEASACGCYVLDLQDLTAETALKAPEIVRAVEWDFAEAEVQRQFDRVRIFNVENFVGYIKAFLARTPYG